MDVHGLAVILQGVLSSNPIERNAVEQSLDKIQYAPEHLVRLFMIIVDGKFDMAVRQVASICFKNFITKNWVPRDRSGAKPKISPGDKQVLRVNIVNFVIQAPPLLRAQLGECLKTMIYADYPEQWPTLLHWVKHNLQDQQVYGALFVLRILSKKYECKLDEERIPVHYIVEETFPHLLNIFNQLLQILNPPIEVAELIVLICKIFWSSVYLEIPRQLFDPNAFNAWMVHFFDILERPVPLEGQPNDPGQRKSWGWWKVKKWTVHILYRLYTRFVDAKRRNPDTTAFFEMIQTNYAGKILECHLNLLNVVRVGGYLPDKVINLILQYLDSSISKSVMYSQLQPRLDVILSEIIFPLMCFNENDQRLWDEDPHEYVRKGYDTVEDLYNPRMAAMGFVSELMRKRGKENLQKFIFFIVDIFRRYDEAAPEYKSHRQKDGALLAIGVLCDKLRQTEPYKSELERMLVQHVFPEFCSPVGHLRAKAAWVAGRYACISFSDPNNFHRALRSVIAGMRDLELPVRVDSVFALRFFVESCKDLGEIRPILPQLLDEVFKLMNEVENEELVSTLATIVDKFGEEIAPYAIGLCQNLAAAFWKSVNTAETDEEGDACALASVGCLWAISMILESIRSLPHLYEHIESTLLPIIHRMLTTDEVLEEVLEIVSDLTFYSPTISMEMWSLWPLMMETLTVWAIDFFPNIMVPLENYISRSTSHFLTCKEPDYQLSLWNMISSVMKDENLDDCYIEPAPKLIQVVFQNCRGYVDHWVEPYLKISMERLRRTKKSRLKCRLMEVVAVALYYNAPLALHILQKLNVATEVFTLWFQMLQQTKRSGVRAYFRREHEKKVCCLGLTSLLPLPANQLPVEALELIFKSVLNLLVAYKDQLAEAVKEEESDDIGNFPTNDEGDDADDSNNMGSDAEDEDGDEAEGLKHKTLAARDNALHTTESEDEDSDDGFSDYEEFQSPIDEIDPFVFFVDAIIVLQTSDPLRFQNLTQTLNLQYQEIATGITHHAEERRTEIEKAKLAKVTKSAD